MSKTKEELISLYDDEKYEIAIRKRNKIFSKANEIIQKSKYSLTLRQQKLISYILSCLKAPNRNGEYNLEVLFNIEEYCRVTGIDYNQSTNYNNIKQDIKKLRDKSLWIPIKNKNGEIIDTLVSWIEKTRACESRELIYVKIDEDLAPYLFELSENFTQFELRFLLSFEKNYSMRLYEIVKSWNNLHKHTYTIDEIRNLLNIEDIKTFTEYKNLKSKILVPCIEEINSKTDIKITMREILGKKSGKGRKKVEKIEFRVAPIPDNIVQTRRYTIDDKLDGTNKVTAYEQLCMFKDLETPGNSDMNKDIVKKPSVQEQLEMVDDYINNLE